MSRTAKLLGGALVAVLALGVGFGSLAFADSPQSNGDTGNGQTAGWCVPQGLGSPICLDEVSDLLGLSPEEIVELRHEGMSLAEIAEAQGVDRDTLVDTILSERQERLQARVSEGILTEDQASQILERMREQIAYAVTRTTFGPFGAPGHTSMHGWIHDGTGARWGEPGLGTGPGMMHQWGPHDGDGSSWGEPGLGTGPGMMHGWGPGPR